MSDTIRERIISVMQSTQSSPSGFAKKIGIQRSTLSHVITKRNNPSLDLVLKVHAAFPTINMEWLILGKGNSNLPKTILDTLEEKRDGKDSSSSHTNSIEEDNSNASLNNNNSTNPQKAVSLEDVKIAFKDQKKLTQVIQFFSDGSFISYQSKI